MLLEDCVREELELGLLELVGGEPVREDLMRLKRGWLEEGAGGVEGTGSPSITRVSVISSG